MDGNKQLVSSEWIDFDIMRFLGVLYQRRRTIVLVTLFFALLGGLYLGFATPVFETSTTMEVYTRRPRVSGSGEAVLGQDAMTVTAVADAKTTLFHKIQNRVVLDKLVKELRRSEAAAPHVSSLTAEELYNFVQNRSEFEQVQGTHLFRVTTTSSSPDFSVIFANTYAQVIVDHIKDVTKEESLDAVRWLQEQIEVYKKELMKNEAKLIAFKQHHNLEGLLSNKTALDQGLLAINADLVRFQTEASVLADMLTRLQGMDVTVDAAGVLPSSIPRYEYIQGSLQELLLSERNMS